MRAYTNLEQSRKLAEILPIESADFHFSANLSPRGFLEIPKWGNPEDANYSAFPCWSLAALIDILPFEVSINKQTDGVDTYCYIASYDARPNRDVFTHRHINLVDASVEMLLKLHGLKLL